MAKPRPDSDSAWDLPEAFPGDYRDPRSPAELAEDQRRVQSQINGLMRRGHDASTRRILLQTLQERRATRDDLVTFDFIPSIRGYDTLIARGELLVRTQVLDDHRLADFLARQGLTERPDRPPEKALGGRVVQLVREDIGAQRLNDIARFLRQLGVQASVNHITPLGPVGKGIGGPERSAGSRDYRPGPRGVRVDVIDTGIAAEKRKDGWLAERDVPRNLGPKPPSNIDPLDELPGTGDGTLDSGAGHGSMVTGLVQQVEVGAEIRMHRGLFADAFATEVEVAAAMVTAVRQGAQILNCSFGTETIDNQRPVAMEVALELIEEEERRTGREVVIVAAAGNSGSTQPCFPAAFPSTQVIAVAALTEDGRPADWSNRGFWVDCSVVAQGALSTFVQGTESWDFDQNPDTFPANAWALWSGTSFAAPQVSGAIARLCRERGLPPRQAAAELLRRGTPIPDFGRGMRILPGT